MSDCPIELNADGYLECPDCNWIYKGKATAPRRNCPNSPDVTEAAERLGITGDDIKHWAHALAKWIRAGFPRRSQAEVDHCMRICVKCDQFVPDNPRCHTEACQMKVGGRCKACRCRVSMGRVAVANKLAMATEACPEGKWEATA